MQTCGSDRNEELFVLSAADAMIAKEGDDILVGWDGGDPWFDAADGDKPLCGIDEGVQKGLPDHAHGCSSD